MFAGAGSNGQKFSRSRIKKKKTSRAGRRHICLGPKRGRMVTGFTLDSLNLHLADTFIQSDLQMRTIEAIKINKSAITCKCYNNLSYDLFFCAHGGLNLGPHHDTSPHWYVYIQV